MTNLAQTTGVELQTVLAPEVLASPGRKDRGRVAIWGPPLIVFAIMIGLWYLGSYYLLSPDQQFLLPPPHQVLQVGLLDSDNRAEIMSGLLLTTEVAGVGLLIAMGLGLALAVVMSQALWVERSLFPYAVILQTIPVLALVPLIGFWFDFGFTARLIVVVMIAIFPIIANTLFGLKSAEAGQHDLFTLHGASRWTRLTKLQIPAALPSIFTGLRISAGLSVVGSVVGDFFFKQGDPGLGILIQNYQSRLQSEQLFSAILVASLLGVVVFWGFGLLSNVVVGSWHTSSQSR